MYTMSLCLNYRLRRLPTVCSHKLHICDAQVKKRIIQYIFEVVAHVMATSRKGHIWIAEKLCLHYQYLTMSRAIDGMFGRGVQSRDCSCTDGWLVFKTVRAAVTDNSFSGNVGDYDASYVFLTTRYASQSFQRHM